MKKQEKKYLIIAFSAMLGYYMGKVSDNTFILITKKTNPLGELIGDLIVLVIILGIIRMLVFKKDKR